ncbi:LysM peptidoglycan-binding domain-containing protein [Vogesella sp. LIG4]|uniref:lytic transglycosylase n=1 Tax=Vogesella sp. LIG4 TaxID=1192162 RepID=UPI00081FBBDE|nr:LysM peptidoglycan-binding domain-containing protein [Vogesella sp. LIG4]SCK20468.1 membrane-bound lytic murein transglycosylase D [Vogesella sp. LIG4]
MKKLTPLALSVSLAFALAPAHAASAPVSLSQPQRSVDDGLAAGLDMMLLNTSLLRNGDNVWQRVREGFQMSEVNPELVRLHERLYSSKADYFRRSLDRSRKYLFYIMNEVERRGMPTEIALLPMVESAFVATADSPVGASGLWQFMPTTGRQYGLEQTWWYDGRRDVLESTRAALDYLQNLYGMFGDWSLALAAYNWGEGNLAKAIAKVRARGEVENYENIQMPKETRNYVPKLLAVRNLLQNPEKFGLRMSPFPNKPSFVAVSVGRHMNIDLAARMADMSVAEFKELNPAFNLPVFAYKNGRQMLLPESKLHKFETNLAKWDKPLLTWQVYVPDSDTNPAQLAGRFDMNTTELTSANNLRGNPVLPAGRPVLVALRGNANAAPQLDATDIAAPAAETATLVAFAANGNPAPQAPVASSQPLIAAAATSTTPVAVRSAQLDSKPQPASQATVQAASQQAAASSQPVLTAVASQNTIKPQAVSSIAKADAQPALQPAALVVSKPAVPVVLAQAESSKPAATPAVDAKPAAAASGNDAPRITIRSESKPAATMTALATPDRVVTASAGLHTVAAGDTLFNISRRYGMSVDDLKQLNSLNDSNIRLGQTLKILSTQPAQPAAAATALASNSSPLRQVSYTVRQPATGAVPADYVVQRGDTVFSIARKFSVSHTDILRWNDPEQISRLQPGQKIRVQQEDDGL